MKTYYICVAVIFLIAYAVFHFGFRSGGDGRLYRINDRAAFELNTPGEFYNGIAIRSYRVTNGFVKFICGGCEADYDGPVEMVNVKYRSGDFIYTDTPQHATVPTDIFNVKTGEAIEAVVPEGFQYGDDFSKLPEYSQRGLAAVTENELTQDYIKANFAPMPTFTNRCLYANILFLIAALLLAFPNATLELIGAFFKSFDPSDPANYHRGGL